MAENVDPRNVIPSFISVVYVKLKGLVNAAGPVAFAHIGCWFGILVFLPNVSCPPTGAQEKEVEK